MTASRTRRLGLALLLVTVGVAMTWFAVAAILAEQGGDDPVLVELTQDHGLHRRDLPAAGLGVVGIAAAGVGVRLTRRPM